MYEEPFSCTVSQYGKCLGALVEARLEPSRADVRAKRGRSGCSLRVSSAARLGY